MAMQGGGDRSWLKPMAPNGSFNEDSPEGADIVGCHKGFYAGLNIANPEAGYAYQWIRNDPRDIFTARQRGWNVVDTSGSDKPAFMLVTDGEEMPTQLDSSGVYQDIVLVRITEDQHEKLNQSVRERADSQLRDGTDAFLDGASEAEMATGRTARGRVPTRMARSEHGLQAQQDGETVRIESQRGILQD